MFKLQIRRLVVRILMLAILMVGLAVATSTGGASKKVPCCSDCEQILACNCSWNPDCEMYQTCLAVCLEWCEK